MNVTEVKLYKSQKDGIVKAFGKAVVDNELVLDVLVMEKNDGKGPWATFPNGRTGTDGKYYLPVFWKSKEKDQEFKAKVIEGYNAQVAGGTPAPASTPSDSAPAQESLPF